MSKDGRIMSTTRAKELEKYNKHMQQARDRVVKSQQRRLTFESKPRIRQDVNKPSKIHVNHKSQNLSKETIVDYNFERPIARSLAEPKPVFRMYETPAIDDSSENLPLRRNSVAEYDFIDNDIQSDDDASDYIHNMYRGMKPAVSFNKFKNIRTFGDKPQYSLEGGVEDSDDSSSESESGSGSGSEEEEDSGSDSGSDPGSDSGSDSGSDPEQAHVAPLAEQMSTRKSLQSTRSRTPGSVRSDATELRFNKFDSTVEPDQNEEIGNKRKSSNRLNSIADALSAKNITVASDENDQLYMVDATALTNALGQDGSEHSRAHAIGLNRSQIQDARRSARGLNHKFESGVDQSHIKFNDKPSRIIYNDPEPDASYTTTQNINSSDEYETTEAQTLTENSHIPNRRANSHIPNRRANSHIPNRRANPERSQRLRQQSVDEQSCSDCSKETTDFSSLSGHWTIKLILVLFLSVPLLWFSLSVIATMSSQEIVITPLFGYPEGLHQAGGQLRPGNPGCLHRKSGPPPHGYRGHPPLRHRGPRGPPPHRQRFLDEFRGHERRSDFRPSDGNKYHIDERSRVPPHREMFDLKRIHDIKQKTSIEELNEAHHKGKKKCDKTKT